MSATQVEELALVTVRAMVKDGRGLDVLRILWPEPLSRPLYTIGDMERYRAQLSDHKGSDKGSNPAEA